MMPRKLDERVFTLEQANEAVVAALRPLCQELPAETLELCVRAAGVDLARADRDLLVRLVVRHVEALGELLGVLEGDQRVTGLERRAFQPGDNVEPRYESPRRDP